MKNKQKFPNLITSLNTSSLKRDTTQKNKMSINMPFSTYIAQSLPQTDDGLTCNPAYFGDSY